MPRAIYWRRRLLLLAALILLAWVILQIWQKRHSSEPVSEPTSTASAPATQAPTPTPTPSPTPSTDTTTTVALTGGKKVCDPHKIRMSPYVADGQQAQRPVNVDLAIRTTAKKPCLFKPKTYDPLAVVSRGEKRLWDSSVCKAPVAGGSLQLIPGWSTVVQVPWVPRRSGDSCSKDERWLAAGVYTLEIGTLGGEPGEATFTLAPPPPPPSPTPTPTASPAPVKPAPTKPAKNKPAAD